MTTRLPFQQQLSSEKSLEEVETAGVVVGKAAGRMEVKVKVKQTETVAGPKVRAVCTVPYYKRIDNLKIEKFERGIGVAEKQKKGIAGVVM